MRAKTIARFFSHGREFQVRQVSAEGAELVSIRSILPDGSVGRGVVFGPEAVPDLIAALKSYQRLRGGVSI